MRLEVRKREVTEVGTLEKLVVENVDGIEPGLTVIDSRLLLGHATIDLVAQDASGALVLIALGFRGDEGMLLRIVDAYSWCLEYPESVQRHYPTLAISESQPPRVVFVMARVPESFQRKVKQLSFPSVDAVELHYIDVNGVSAVYFDTVAQIRRSPQGGTPTIERPAPARVVAEPARVAAEPVEAEDPMRLVNELAARSAANGAGAKPAAPRVEPVAARAKAAVVEPPVRIAAAVRPEAAVVVSTTQIPAAGEPAPAPVVVPVIAGSSDAGAKRERVSLASAMCHVIDGSAHIVGEEDEGAVAVADIEDEPLAEPTTSFEPAAEIVEPVQIVETAAAPVEAVAEPVVEAVAEAVVEPPAAAEEPTPVAAAPEAAEKYPFSEAARAAQLAQDLGIQLPKEGALTRQWIDFLNQLAAK